MNRTYLIMGSVIAAVSVTSVAAFSKGLGGEHRGRPKINFEEVDINDDGVLSQAELEVAAAARFAKIDTNKDAVLTTDELQAELAARMHGRVMRQSVRMMRRMDADGDGVLTSNEMKPGHGDTAKMFERLDQDRDGQISKKEFAAARAKRLEGHNDKERRGKGPDVDQD